MARFYNPAGGAAGDSDILQFTTGNDNDPGVAQLTWDDAFETLQIGLDAHVDLQIGQEHLVRVKNASGTTAITDGSVVMFAGATGDTVTVTPAVADGSYDRHLLVGVATETIAADDFGFVTQLGFVNGIKTDYAGWLLGDLLYADPTTPGALTKTAPQAPAWYFPVAAVTRVNAESGRILVRAIPPEGNATIINTDGNAGTKIYVGSVDPNTLYTLQPGDIWIETA
jgi:hypothetical protein